MVTANAYAKLNLCLDILGKLPSGYHEISSVFQTVSLKDTVSIEFSGEGIEVTCDKGDITPQDNLCYKAAELYFQKAGIFNGVKIDIKKNIPLSAGLGGGSADAAAVLNLLNQKYNALSGDELLKVALKCGADVPFLLSGGTKKIGGIGEIIEDVNHLPDCDIVIIKEGIKPSTAELYKRYDEISTPEVFATDKMCASLRFGDIKQISACLFNGFSYVWGSDIDAIKKELISLGALGAELSGSGPSVFGIFSKGEGESAYNILKEKYREIYICNPV